MATSSGLIVRISSTAPLSEMVSFWAGPQFTLQSNTKECSRGKGLNPYQVQWRHKAGVDETQQRGCWECKHLNTQWGGCSSPGKPQEHLGFILICLRSCAKEGLSPAKKETLKCTKTRWGYHAQYRQCVGNINNT